MATYFATILSLLFCLTLAWDYRKGGDDWDFKSCNDLNEQQSPIQLDTSQARSFLPPFYLFPRVRTPIQLKYVDYGWTLKLEGDCGYMYTVEPLRIVHGLTFGCRNIEFHAPAEHTIDGKSYALEMQIYMTFVNGAAVPVRREAAFSFFFEASTTDNPFLAQFVNKLTTNNTVIDVSFDSLFQPDMLTKEKLYSYRGSRTSPNCGPTVNWYLILPAMQISPAQLKVFTARWQDNPNFAGGRGNNRNAKPQNITVFRYP